MNQAKVKGSFCQSNGISDYLAEELPAVLKVHIEVCSHIIILSSKRKTEERANRRSTYLSVLGELWEYRQI